ncbi:unannotated protein [freshwater metagenome]|uniref:Unannotated protein n=1 Tax=freshwater metagenome TaxID=449393 RepID=A0A6J6LGK7_9ZZZZ
MRSIRPGRNSASSNASGIFVAITTKIRYFGGFLGRIPRVRLTIRLKNPRGFFNPESSVKSACSVPIPPPPPPPPAAPPTTKLSRTRTEAVAGDK